tara:strand:+ start:937 stop:1200 length:264 start_codon:yes stop_codon:yes gene_type:complete
MQNTKTNLFKYEKGWGDATPANNIIETKSLKERDLSFLLAKDINGDWHNGYFFRQYDTNFIPADYRNPKMFLSRWKLNTRELQEFGL